jgi:hypothetical protein
MRWPSVLQPIPARIEEKFMSTIADIIPALVKSKSALQDQCDAADGEALTKLTAAIHRLSAEIGAYEAQALSTAPYVPATDPFKADTAEAQDFLKTLDNLKGYFSDAIEVASALDTVIKVIAKGAL